MAQIIDPPNPNFSTSFLSFIKDQEGLIKDPKTGSLVYQSLEGGTPTVGYGHKLTPDEIKAGSVYGNKLSTLTEKDVESILLEDLRRKQKTLDRSLNNKYGIGLSELPEETQEMLLDYEFNLGSALSVFPTFSEAVIAGDVETARKEYERTYLDAKSKTRKPLEKRNKDFYERYLK